MKTGRLAEALSLGERAHIALVGAGGKTTMMWILFEELASWATPAAATTTTKVYLDQARRYPCMVLRGEDGNPEKAISRCIERYGSVFVGERLLPTGKIEGISPETADCLFLARAIPYIMVEADGAAGMPIKAPAEHEPVVPSSATHVIALMGCEAIEMPLDPFQVFRHERVAELTGLRIGDRLTPEALSRLFLDQLGLFKASPQGALKMVFVNKTDLAEDRGPAERLARLLLSEGTIDRVVLGSLRDRCYDVF